MQAAHAAGAPDRGRSALDAVELTCHAVELLREHVDEEARLHHVITSGGAAPNIVPEFAEVYFYVRHPKSPVVCFAGDGCFAMTSNELGTAVQYGLAMPILIANNGMFGTIRMHQERQYPGRTSGTSLVNPDFAALAKAHGANGAVVTRSEDFEAVFREALAADGPFVIDLRTDPEAITPMETLSGVRQSAAPKARK